MDRRGARSVTKRLAIADDLTEQLADLVPQLPARCQRFRKLLRRARSELHQAEVAGGTGHPMFEEVEQRIAMAAQDFERHCR